MRIGVLALQGAVAEHLRSIEMEGVEAVPVKRKGTLQEIDGIVLPGGESTTIGKLLLKYDMLDLLRAKIRNGFPVFGTCAGLILLAKHIVGYEQPHLGVMDIEVERNSFGRQRESFEADLSVPVLGESPFRAVFIRAPHIVGAGPQVHVLATYQHRIVAARQNHMLVAAFHPELTDDTRFHRYFIEMVAAPQRTTV
jgi:5'-phosphate synthase pdxT subunit